MVKKPYRSSFNFMPNLGLVSKAFLIAVTLEKSVNSFRKTGIQPLNRNVFLEHKFVKFENKETGTTEVTVATYKDKIQKTNQNH